MVGHRKPDHPSFRKFTCLALLYPATTLTGPNHEGGGDVKDGRAGEVSKEMLKGG